MCWDMCWKLYVFRYVLGFIVYVLGYVLVTICVRWICVEIYVFRYILRICFRVQKYVLGYVLEMICIQICVGIHCICFGICVDWFLDRVGEMVYTWTSTLLKICPIWKFLSDLDLSRWVLLSISKNFFKFDKFSIKWNFYSINLSITLLLRVPDRQKSVRESSRMYLTLSEQDL